MSRHIQLVFLKITSFQMTSTSFLKGFMFYHLKLTCDFRNFVTFTTSILKFFLISSHFLKVHTCLRIYRRNKRLSMTSFRGSKRMLTWLKVYLRKIGYLVKVSQTAYFTTIAMHLCRWPQIEETEKMNSPHNFNNYHKTLKLM